LGFFLSGGGLQAIDQQSGIVSWSYAGDGTLSSAPLVIGGMVYMGSSSGHLYAINAATGGLAYSATLPAPVNGPDEQNVSQPLTGLGAGAGTLVVPASSWLVAFTSALPPTNTPTNTATSTPTSSPTSTATSSPTKTPAPVLTASGVSLNAEARRALNNVVVANFSDTKPGTVAGSYTANIGWGDGSAGTAGTITGSGPFSVKGSHTYNRTGNFAITVSIRATADSRAAVANSSVLVVK
jgi:outer membrane protein assembly factor BamB